MDNNSFKLTNPSLTRGILVMILGVLVFTMGLGVLGTLLGLLFLGYGVYEAVMFSQKNKETTVSRAAWKKTEETQIEAAAEGCGLKRYHLVDNIMGWVVGIVACTVYILTAEATASWWDCGEYIATANKLQVGHPPGAPSFQVMGRLFSMFSDPVDVAHAVNVMSAVCSGLTIMFLFWGITMLGKHLLPDPKNVDVKSPRTWVVFAAGLVGAFAYCFSDSFWFSAVEGEVYAMSSFFTALVFWAILKWEEQSDDKRSLRWIVLISLLVGVAIGVHLLNLLTVPAIFYVVYFKKWPKVTWKGFLLTGVISFVTLALILWAIIPGIVNLDSAFDVFFVNMLGLPFNSGTIFYFVLLAALVVWGLWFSQRKKRPMLNAAIMSFAMLVIGYSTFFVLVIRANTNTPLNENCPKDAVAMRAYLGREQYGETPFLTGHYYTESPVDAEKGYTKYVRGKDGNGKDCYIPAAYEQVLVYEESSHFLPRMWSNQRGQHPRYYRYWTEVTDPKQEPTFGDNITFMNRYQFGWMYWRYFMWNFAGRQNDQQGHYFNDDGTRDYLHGNWICGINAIDEARLGPQSDLPDFMANDKSRNVYYLLPLLLGLLGLFYHIKKHPNDAFIVLLMFLMTGMAIAFYLNMPPVQPRERDYAFVGSFSFFAIWIGLGVMGLSEWISDIFKEKKEKMYKWVMPAVFVLCMLGVPVLMACQNWDDHDRSEKTAARDYAENCLLSIGENGILITFGDNDTFPLWYIQEVEGVRTDVRILNYTLSGMYWYVEQLFNKLYDSEPLPFTLTKDFYGLGKDVFHQVHLPGSCPNLKPDEEGYYEVTEVLSEIRDNAEQYKFKTFFKNNRKAVVDYYTKALKKYYSDMIKKQSGRNDIMYQQESELNRLVNEGLARMLNEEKVSEDSNYVIPVGKFKITLDIPELVKKGVVSAEQALEMDSVIRWVMNESDINSLQRQEMMLFDIIGTNKFKRDIYCGNPLGGDISNVFPPIMIRNIQDGLNYKIIPYVPKCANCGYVQSDYCMQCGYRTIAKTRGNIVCTNDNCGFRDPKTGELVRRRFAYSLDKCPMCGVETNWRQFTETSADYLLGLEKGKKLSWGNLDKDIYVDPVSSGMILPQIFYDFLFLAKEEHRFGNDEKAKALLDEFEKHFPAKNFVPDNEAMLRYIPYIEIIFDGFGSVYGNDSEEMIRQWNRFFDYNCQYLEYLLRFDEDKREGIQGKLDDMATSLTELYNIALNKMHDKKSIEKAEKFLEKMNLK